mmetsp:Transcript_8928/g.36119  ORF Transcript_8928/g.36119 Transcript_8928/m.36119 type:complete len:112 (+) Transcript_8928:757-1092(+)
MPPNSVPRRARSPRGAKGLEAGRFIGSSHSHAFVSFRSSRKFLHENSRRYLVLAHALMTYDDDSASLSHPAGPPNVVPNIPLASSPRLATNSGGVLSTAAARAGPPVKTNF